MAEPKLSGFSIGVQSFLQDHKLNIEKRIKDKLRKVIAFVLIGNGSDKQSRLSWTLSIRNVSNRVNLPWSKSSAQTSVQLSS